MWLYLKSRNHFSTMLTTPLRRLYMFQSPPDVRGSKVKKFEQVSNDVHQMSVAEWSLDPCAGEGGNHMPIRQQGARFPLRTETE